MPSTGTRFGLLLPHFGEHARWTTVLGAARHAERYGFDSVWVRDHLVFHPHGIEGTDPTFFEPFTVLAAVAAATERITLGTASLIPHRHAIYTAQLVACLSALAPGRVIIGFGAGAFNHEFESIGLGAGPRWDLVREQVTVIRALVKGESLSHQGAHYRFRDVSLRPTAVGEIPIWYCGGTPASTRYAVEYCDGWMPGRITFPTYAKRVEALRKMAAERGRAMPALAAVPITSPGRSREDAVARVNLGGLLKNANGQRFWVRPPGGTFQTADDLGGSFIYGAADDIVEQVRRYREIGIDHLVFDLRFRFDEYFDCLSQLGEEVLPKLVGS